MTTRTSLVVNVKKMLAGDIYKPNGTGPEATVSHIKLCDVREGCSPASRQLTIHHTDGSSRTVNHGARRTVRRDTAAPAADTTPPAACRNCRDTIPADEVTELRDGTTVCLDCYDETEDVL